MEEEKILKELHSFNNLIRGFCENFDCGDLSCYECPVGEDLCLALGKQDLERKAKVKLTPVTLLWFMSKYWRELLLAVTISLNALTTLRLIGVL